jgi:hypothetical protein
MQTIYYTGVGSRKTPSEACAGLRAIAHRLARAGYTLRSGAAQGADTAFEEGAAEFLIRSPKQMYDIYLPWEGYEGRKKSLNYHVPEDCPPLLWKEAMLIAAETHPSWSSCSKGAKTLHTRNVFQVLGHDLQSPSKFLICWADVDKRGVPKGGTATAWNLAKQFNINCFNMNIVFDQHDILQYLTKLKVN